MFNLASITIDNNLSFIGIYRQRDKFVCFDAESRIALASVMLDGRFRGLEPDFRLRPEAAFPSSYVKE